MQADTQSQRYLYHICTYADAQTKPKLTELKIEKLILFSDTIRTLLQHSKTFFIIIRRTIVILIRWNKRLSVKTLQINDSFLLTNGLIIINWQLKNFLWVKINNKIFTINTKGVLFHFDRLDNPINIKIVGLFSKYEKAFVIVPNATIQSQNLKTPAMNIDKFKVGELHKSISHFEPTKFKLSTNNGALAINIKPLKIILPTFKKDKYHE